MSSTLLRGDCRWYMQRFSCQVDAVVTDCPYELGFMSKPWDQRGISYDPRTWKLAHAVLKPGGRLLAFGAPRTHHRIWTAIEDAGFVIEDTVMWMFGTGFPKHASKLKPMYEPVCVARKGLVTALNVDTCRIGTGEDKIGGGCTAAWFPTGDGTHKPRTRGVDYTSGRWPSNIAMDEDAAKMLDEQTGERPSMLRPGQTDGRQGSPPGFFGRFKGTTGAAYDDSGGASRFLYVAKASRAERDAGLDGLPLREAGKFEDDAYEWPTDGRGNPRTAKTRLRNGHPTVKPLALMSWLVKLVTEPGDLVLDPFAGSGTTGMACVLEGREFIGIEREPEWADIAERRIANALGPLFADGAA